MKNVIKFYSIVENLVPEYVKEEFPLVVEFLSQYYKSQENQSAALDILHNVDKYVQVDSVANLNLKTILTYPLEFESEIFLESSEELPKNYGLIKVDNEIIWYDRLVDDNQQTIECVIEVGSTSFISEDISNIIDTNNEFGNDWIGKVIYIKDSEGNIVTSTKITSVDSGLSVSTENPLIESDSVEYYNQNNTYTCIINGTKLTNCTRGFSAVTSYDSDNTADELVYEQSSLESHELNSEITNLSIIFLTEFLKKIKVQLAPGFEDEEFYEKINEATFIKNIKQFYASKGTDCSFELLFRALFGEDVNIILPRDFVISASDSQYNSFRELVVEQLEGNPEDLENLTLYQDDYGNIPQARGTVAKVEKIQRGDSFYYKIFLDKSKENTYSSNIGQFSIHTKSKTTFNIQSRSDFIDVDSTIGFPESGEIEIVKITPTNDNTQSTVVFGNRIATATSSQIVERFVVQYSSKTSTQFLGCIGIDRDIPLNSTVRINTFAYGNNGSETIKVSIGGVLSSANVESSPQYSTPNEKIKIKTLGSNLRDIKTENWIYNISTKYDVKNISFKLFEERTDRFGNQIKIYTYEISLYDDSILNVGDSVSLLYSKGDIQNGTITKKIDLKTFLVVGFAEIDESLKYQIRKNISKVESINYPELSSYSTNVQNVYVDKNKDIFVNSQSLPRYLNEPLLINDRLVSFSGSFSDSEIITIESHGFYTGDSVVYEPIDDVNTLNIKKGIYFVYAVDKNKIKIARSRENIDTNNFIKVTGVVTDNKFRLEKYCNKELLPKKLLPQNIFRKISESKISEGNKSAVTAPGTIGLFVNGVEILNYKSKDNIFYGQIEEIFPTSSGNGYDIINPPLLKISDENGSGANGYVAIRGSLDKVDIIDPGFDFIETPTAIISGGNGIGARVSLNLLSFDHSSYFNAKSGIDTSINTIGFSTYHGFRNNEVVYYDPQNQTKVVGLSTNSQYYVSVIDPLTIKLHNSFGDASSGINTVSLVGVGTGRHYLTSIIKKKKIGSVQVVNSGSGYETKKRTISLVGINTYSSIIQIDNHDYKNGEIVVYNSSTTPIGGLTSGNSYYVTVVDSNRFKLSNIGLGLTEKNYFYKTKNYINFTSSGVGTHYFDYEPITIAIIGKTGVGSTFANQPNLRPVFLGKITSVHLENKGSSYGSDIINYKKQPNATLLNGKNAAVKPVIKNGKIVSVIIVNGGSEYYSIPQVKVLGKGSGAILTPIIENNVLSEVKVISGGGGYEDGTIINIIPSGSESKFESKIQSWRFDIFERLFANQQITPDDGFLYEGKNDKNGLEYTHLYAPRKLRESINGQRIINGKTAYNQDLGLVDGSESTSLTHSPIIGWAYDSNPIYGPYGYAMSNLGTAGAVKQMKSGYELINGSLNRPNYPIGSFIEDYYFADSGDLDEHNGRFCITPEFPNGVYAYFCTIDLGLPEVTGVFKGYKKPKFPYIIGNTYKSSPIDFNFLSTSNLNKFNLNESSLLRNTKPYGLLSPNTYYDQLHLPTKNQVSVIKSVSGGKIDSIGIVTGGNNYFIGEKIKLSNEKVNATVSQLEGKYVNKISVAATSIYNVEFISQGGNYIGFSSTPHNLLNNDLVSITSSKDNNISGRVLINPHELRLRSGIESSSVTGIVTYLDVYGSLDSSKIRENDIYYLGSEQIKILNIYPEKSEIRILREQFGTVGLTSIFVGIALTENPRKFNINFGITTSYNLVSNKELYFDPNESVGLGTTAGVGIVSTLYFSRAGAGTTLISIPTKSIYLPNHNFNTGDSLIYNSNGGTRVSVSTDGISTFQLENNSKVYVAKISNDLIGISTVNIGIGSTGTFVGISTEDRNKTTLFFTSVGSGNTHSFKTSYSNTFVANVSKNVVSVETSEPHGLSRNDDVEILVLSDTTSTFNVVYNKKHRRVLIDSRNFVSSDVDILEDTITINNHRLKTGQKVIHTCSGSPVGGILNDEIYYAIVVSDDKLRLSNSYYESTTTNPSYINLTSISSGTISKINPEINTIRNSQIVFDLSDSSLSFNKNGENIPGFRLDFYKDPNFVERYETSFSQKTFDIQRIGKVGVDTTARVLLNITNFPKILYYKLNAINADINSKENLEVLVDDEISNNNKIIATNSLYNGNYSVVGVGTTLFYYNILRTPELSSYTSNSSEIKYYANSSSASGSISKVNIISSDTNLKSLPKIEKSDNGALLYADGSEIGKVGNKNIKVLDIGYDYSSDFSIRPTAKFSSLFEIDSFSTIESIKVISVGKNYSTKPNLILVDSLTQNEIDDVVLDYDITSHNVNILKNTNKISGNYTPRIITINNSNGVGISSIEFSSSNNTVTVGLVKSYNSSSEFPFRVNDQIFIENVSVGIGSTLRGYNSSEYNYNYFTIVGVHTNAGGIGASITYSMNNYLGVDEILGTFDSLNSSGKVIRVDDLPTFEVKTRKILFSNEEEIVSNGSKGIIESHDPDRDILKVSTTDEFDIGNTIRGISSNSVAKIRRIKEFDLNYNINASSISEGRWNNEIGFLDYNTQRIHDSDYYQYFSYSIQSKVEYEKWNENVSKLNHTSGFKKFSDLIVDSDPKSLGMNKEQNGSDISGIADIYTIVNTNCYYDFDLVRENNIEINSKIGSNEISFNSKILQDYIESVGNRVLVIDDISDQFNSNPRVNTFSIVDTFSIINDFDITNRYKKYFFSIYDAVYQDDVEVGFVSLLHDDEEGYLNQYGFVPTNKHLGRFDFSISSGLGQLEFYPVSTIEDIYDIHLLSFSIPDITSGIGSTSVGDIVNIYSNYNQVSTSTTTSIVSISTTYRSSKVIVQIGSTDTNYTEINEYNILHDGSNVEFLEYGFLNTSSIFSASGEAIATYNFTIDGGNLVMELNPIVGYGSSIKVNTFVVSIGDTNATGIGTNNYSNGSIKSNFVSISSSPSPTTNEVITFNNTVYGCYYIATIEDLTNNQYQTSEIIVVRNDTESGISEFGCIYTSNTLGDFTTDISGSNCRLLFTPVADADVEVRIVEFSLYLENESLPSSLDLLNGAEINYSTGDYTGTELDIRRSFELTYNQNPIFQKEFDATSSNSINILDDIIKIPNHYFVTGEKVSYSYLNSLTSTEDAIGIATTTISGVGSTDKLPNTLYIVKINESEVKVAASSSEALYTIPNTLDITSLGIGTGHLFTSKKQNTKCLLSIDNIIQSPIVSLATTTKLLDSVSRSTNIIDVANVNNFYGSDLIKINDEIMKIRSVGFGSTSSILVQRARLGTEAELHNADDIVTKIIGNYNIIGNTVHFSEPPFGKVPFTNPNDRPDEDDYFGIEFSSRFNGRAFIRSGIENTSTEPYEYNYLLDSLSEQFTGISTEFTLKSNSLDVSGISTSNAFVLINNVFQFPSDVTGIPAINAYSLEENLGITSIRFEGNAIANYENDINTTKLPRGGIIISIGSSAGFGYQSLVAAGGTAVVSGLGTIQSISIGNSGSGYRSGIQTVNVGVTTDIEYGIFNIGTAIISSGNVVSVDITNPGIGYTTSNPPLVVFDSPLSYYNIPLVYSSSSSGVGTGARVSVIVGQGSSVIDFNVENYGFGYKVGDILTIESGGSAGIPTDISLPFEEFSVFVDGTYTDNFSAWTVGDLQILDSIEDLIDGQRKIFPIKIDGQQITIRARKGSGIDVQSTLLVFVNDVLQVPGDGYIFNGGSVIEFIEAPKANNEINGKDSIKILFYKGTGSVDTRFVNILEPVETGDSIFLNQTNTALSENERLVEDIINSDLIASNSYFDVGITSEFRSATLCRQTEDRFVNGSIKAKNRITYEPLIFPTTNIIENVSAASTQIFVESVKTFFDSRREYIQNDIDNIPQKSVRILSQNETSVAIGTAIVSVAGTISSIIISDGGVGYSTSPLITIQNPVGYGVTLGIGTTALAQSTISVGGTVSSITITNSGFGYTTSNPPTVIIESPSSVYEDILNVSYSGDFGIIVGINTTSIVGVASTGIVFDLFIPPTSYLRDSSYNVGIATTGISGIQTNYLFVVNNSNIGNGVTALDYSNSIVGVSTLFLDGIYSAAEVSIAQTSVPGIGITNVSRVVVSVQDYNGLSGTGYSSYFGNYSWGLISDFIRKAPQSFTANINGYSGISTSPIVMRSNSLKYIGYSTT